MRRLVLLVALFAAASAGALAAAPVAAEIPQWRAVLLAASSDSSPPKIRISHHGPVVLNRALPTDAAGYSPYAVRFADSPAPGHTLVWADVILEGRDTRTVSVLYDFAPGSKQPRVTTHSWDIYGYEKRKVNGHTVFVTADPAYYARPDIRTYVETPILVLAYRSGTFVDVTSANPQLIAAELAKYRSGFKPGVCQPDDKMAAYLADMVRLGQTQRGVADVTRMLNPASDAQFFANMNSVLHAKKLIPASLNLAVAAGVPRCDPNKQPAGT
jgi:hypothetical protein